MPPTAENLPVLNPRINDPEAQRLFDTGAMITAKTKLFSKIMRRNADARIK